MSNPCKEVDINGYKYVLESGEQSETMKAEVYGDLIGKKLFIRTVTYHIVGRVTGKMDMFLKMEDASWVADSGRFMNAIKEGKLNEVEPVGEAFVSLSAVCDMFPWNHDLPKNQK